MLTRENLNTIQSEGVYIQRLNSNALFENNYPIEKAGFLEVFSSSDKTYVIQRYTSYEGEIFYTRTCYLGKWQSWYIFQGLKSDLKNLSENLITMSDNKLLVLEKEAGLSVGHKHTSTKSTFVTSGIVESNMNDFKSFSIYVNSPIYDYIILKFRAKSTIGKTKITFRLAYGDKEEIVLSTEYKDYEIKLFARENRSNGKIIGEIYKNASVDFDYIEAYKEYADKEDLSAYRLANSNRNYELVSNTKGAIESLINTAITYNKNIRNLVYGSQHTAYDYNPEAVKGKYQIDCSSFTHLLLKGVRYENMTFFKGENIESNWGYHGINPKEYRWSDEIARFAVEHGYSFYPNDNFNNLRPGDVLFYKWNNSNPNKYKGIQHVGIYLGKTNANSYKHLTVDDAIMENVFYTSNKSYMEKCVLAARFPLAPVESIYSESNLFIESGSDQVSSGEKIRKSLKENLEASTFYTIKFMGFKSTGKYPIIYNATSYLELTNAKGLNINYDNDTLSLYFITPEDFSDITKSLIIKCSGYGEKGSISWEKIKIIKGFAMNDFIA